MNRSGKIHALLSTARVANIPSVVSNVWLGVAVASYLGGWCSFSEPWAAAARLALAGVLLYISGNFLNDWADRAWDLKNRPERALPRGLFPPGLYLGVAAVCAAGGIFLSAVTSLASAAVAVGILGMVAIYTYWHKRSPWAVVAMGLCRALLPVMGAVGFSAVFLGQGDWPGLQLTTGQLFEIRAGCPFIPPYSGMVGACALGLFCHIAGLSLSARYEAMPHTPTHISSLARILFITAVGVISYATYQWHVDSVWFVVAGLLPYGLWTFLSLSLWRKPVSRHVSRLLAGIPLIDWMALLPLSLPSLAVAGMPPFTAACLLIPPLAFVSALVLQRLAPAT
jgi:heme O synthase-like polyprenyltransferase